MSMEYGDMPDRAADRQAAAAWAREVLASPTVVIDTETTGLTKTAEIVQIAVVDLDGTVLLDSLVRPAQSIPAPATRVHGITDELVADAPRFADIAPLLAEAVRDRNVVIYNALYDARVIEYCWTRHPQLGPVPANIPAAGCAMLQYSAFVGSWNDYFGNYRWQRLPSAAHNALGDCLATIALLHRMAGR
jgi:DNA polymerase-3 subunit epsilon